MAKRRSRYIIGTHEELETIDEDMKRVVGQSLNSYIWERVLIPWVEQSPNLPNNFLELPQHVERNDHCYYLRKKINDKRYSFGMYHTKEEVIQVENYLSSKGYPDELLPPNKPKNMKYSEWIKEIMKQDKGDE